MIHRLIIVIFFILSICLNSYAQKLNSPVFPFEENTQLTEEQIKLQKYKMNKLTIKKEAGNWYIIQGINTEISDETLLSLVNELDILENWNRKKTIAMTFASFGGILLLGGGVLVSNVISFENSNLIGIGLMGSGIVFTFIGELISPTIIESEAHHFLTLEQAEKFVDKYNKQLAIDLGLL